ncbi:hypothetical protein EVA_22341, partial [gut metagenome]
QGPIICKNKELDFLDFKQIPTDEPEGRVAPDIQSQFKDFFAAQK